MSLRVLDKLLERARRHLGRYGERQRVDADHRDRGEGFDRVEAEIPIDCSGDGVDVGPPEQQRVAIRGRGSDDFGANPSACAAVILDNDASAKFGGKRLRDQSSGNIGRPPGGEGNDDFDRSFRISFSMARVDRPRCEQDREQGEQPTCHAHRTEARHPGSPDEFTHSTSTIISTSTALLKGSPAMPTAERACLPAASPKTSTIKSENPLMTRGWSPNPSGELTMPRTLTTRLTRSRLPSARCTFASMINPTCRAVS